MAVVGSIGVSEVSDRYVTIADEFSARVRGVSPGTWDAPSPCTEWVARDVVVHVINTHRRVLASLDGTEAEILQSDNDLLAAWPSARDALEVALGDPVRSTAIVGGMFGEQTFESLVGRLLCADTLIHTWDLARATGQDERLDPAAVAKAIECLTPIGEAMRRPGGFGPKIDPLSPADAQTKLLNFAGRAV